MAPTGKHLFRQKGNYWCNGFCKCFGYLKIFNIIFLEILAESFCFFFGVKKKKTHQGKNNLGRLSAAGVLVVGVEDVLEDVKVERREVDRGQLDCLPKHELEVVLGVPPVNLLSKPAESGDHVLVKLEMVNGLPR